MINEELVAYLKAQESEREKELFDYELAIEKREQAKIAYEEAEKEVERFGDMETIKAEKEKISGFIAELTKPEEEVAAEETPVAAEQSEFIAPTEVL